MKPRLHTYGDTSAYRTGTGWRLRPHHNKHSRIGGNWSDMSCSIYAADRGLIAKNYATAVSSIIAPPVGACLTLKEVAFRLQVCRRTLEREIAARRLACVKIGRSVRVLESDLKTYLESLRPSAPSSP